MEVLSPLSASSRNTHLGGSSYWAAQSSFGSPVGTCKPESFARFGPLAPPSPPYEMNNGGHGSANAAGRTEKVSLPPISSLLALTRPEGRDGRASDYRSNSGSLRRSSPARSLRSAETSPRTVYNPVSPPSSSHSSAATREMQAPRTMHAVHGIARIDPATFNGSRPPHGSPRGVSRPTVNTNPQHTRPMATISPYSESAPGPGPATTPAQYSELSPRSAPSSAPHYKAPQWEQHPHTLPAPAPPQTPRKMLADSPQSHHFSALPSQPHLQEESHPHKRPLLPSFAPRSSLSPRQDRTLPSVTSSGYHPYPQHNRHQSHGSTDSAQALSYAPSSPSSTSFLRQEQQQQQQGQAGSASTLQDRYQCPTCAKAFSRPSSLRIHSHSHTGEKPFVCPRESCGKAFSVRSNMKRHERGCHVGTAMSVAGSGSEHAQHHHIHYHQGAEAGGPRREQGEEEEEEADEHER